MTYYIKSTELTTITADTWRHIENGDALDQTARDTHDRDGVFGGLTRLDAAELYCIADAAPAWDCLDAEIYNVIAEGAGLNPADYDDVDELMNAVNAHVAAPLI